MTTTDADPVFLDTNILVYAHFPSAPWHQEALEAVHRSEAAGAARWVSRQVLREYLVAVTRPQQFQHPQPIERRPGRCPGFSTALSRRQRGA